MDLFKNISLWVAAFLIMTALVIYQRATGPTYPIDGEIEIDDTEVEYHFPRSHGGAGGKDVIIETKSENVNYYMKYRRYKSHDDTTVVAFSRDGDVLKATIPHQPPAGKVEYWVFAKNGNEVIRLNEEKVVIRFKGAVPDFVLAPHIIAMFLSMCLSLRVGLEVLFKGKNVYNISLYTAIFLFAGGIILGPIVQKYAFDAYWTGWPFGHDLTDNKTLVSMIMWIVALWRLKKNPNAKGWALAAVIVQLAIYLIPHSVMGSEIDYTQQPQN